MLEESSPWQIMRLPYVALLLFCSYRHQLWVFAPGTTQQDDQNAGVPQSSPLFVEAYTVGPQTGWRYRTNLSVVPEQECELMVACRWHTLGLISFVPQSLAGNALLTRTFCSYNSCWIHHKPQAFVSKKCTSCYPSSSREEIRLGKSRPSATAQRDLSCRPQTHEAPRGHVATGSLPGSSTTACDDNLSLDGIIPVIKPKGPTSGDVCLHIARLRRQHCAQALAERLRPVKAGAPYTDCPERDSDKGLCSVHGTDSKQRTGVGHGGTLDPAASGVLVLALGKGTKVLHKFLTGTKGYRAVVKLGVATDTLDASGLTTRTCDWSHVSKCLLRSTIRSFIGKQLQTPPLYSAKRIRGVRMYDIARGLRHMQLMSKENAVPVPSDAAPSIAETATNNAAATLAAKAVATQKAIACFPGPKGTTIRGSAAQQQSSRQLSEDKQLHLQNAARYLQSLPLTELPQPCEVEIYDAKLLETSDYELPFFEMEVYCSKGTYIRQVAADIAARCHTVAHVVELVSNTVPQVWNGTAGDDMWPNFVAQHMLQPYENHGLKRQ